MQQDPSNRDKIPDNSLPRHDSSTTQEAEVNESKEEGKPVEDLENGINPPIVQSRENGISLDREDSRSVGNGASSGDSEAEAVSVESQGGATEKGTQMQSLEIEDGAGLETNESFDDDGDMEHLLGDPKASTEKKGPHQKRHPLCARPEKVGNMRIFLPALFAKTGWGIAGPHWFGPFCVLFLIGLASHYFIGISMRSIGPITTAICILFTLACTYYLVNVAYRDPGVVKLQPASQRPQETDEDQRLNFRWCDFCQVFQPPDGAHCSDCNVCVAGFDQ